MFEDNPFESKSSGGFMQTGGAPKQTPQSGTPNIPQGGGNTGSGDKYQILNMFWFINPKVYVKENAGWLENETHFCAVSYNINFGNLRIEFANMTQESVQGHLICLNKMQRVLAGTIYPSAMYQVLTGQNEVVCYEQIINYTGENWQQNRPLTKFVVNGQNLVLYIDKHCYEFSEWQKDALLGSFKFGLSTGFQLSGMNLMKR